MRVNGRNIPASPASCNEFNNQWYGEAIPHTTVSNHAACASGFIQAVEIIHGLLRMRRGGEDGALVVFQHLEPGGDIRRVIFTHFRREFEVGAEESASQLRYEFLAGIALVAPCFAAKVAVKP